MTTSTLYRFALVEYSQPWDPPRVLAFYPYPQAAYQDFPALLAEGGWHRPLGLMYVKEERTMEGVLP